MLALRFSLRSLDSPSVANAGLLIILAGMLLLTGSWLGVMPLDPVYCWWFIAMGWSALALHYGQTGGNIQRAVVLRALLVMAGALLMSALPYGLYSDDMHRYQWDGNLLINGVSPYMTVPADPVLAPYAFSTGDVSLPSQLPYADMRTVYPPGAQLVFAVASYVSGGGAQLWKLTFWVLCLLVAWGTWQLSSQQQRAWLVLAGLSPIVLLHGWIDVHLDLLMALLAVMAILFRSQGKLVAAGSIIGLAISIKYLPVLVVPALCIGLKPRQVSMLLGSTTVMIAAVFAPFIGDNVVGSLGVFTSTWQANSGVFTLISSVLDVSATRLSLLILFVLASTYAVQCHYTHPYRAAAMVLMSLAVFSPVVHPWYLIPCMLLLPWASLRSTLTWSVTMALYGVVLTTYKSNGVWTEHPVALAAEFIPVVAAYVIDLRRGPLSLVEKH